MYFAGFKRLTFSLESNLSDLRVIKAAIPEKRIYNQGLMIK